MAVSLSINISQNSQSIANNTSNVTVSVIASWTYGSFNYTSPAPSGWLKIDGTQYNFSSTFNTGQSQTGSQTLFSQTVNISHNSDGSKTLSCSASFATGVSSGTITASASKALTKIPRQANITSAPNFNDEQNPTITYSNSAGNSVTSLQACIADSNGSIIYVPYRDISKTGTSYTFNLTDAERSTLRGMVGSGSNSITVKFYVKSVIGGVTYYSNLPKTLTIINGTPVISPTVADSNSATIALTGDSNKLIRYFSNVAVNSRATARKGATLTSQKITNGSKSISSASGTFSAVESGTFVFSATDNRGNTTTQTVNKTLIPYIPLTCNIGEAKPDTSGNLYFVVNGNYFNGTFGATSNNIRVEYRYKVAGGTYGAWTSMGVMVDGNTYMATDSITGLDYQTAYVFQARAVDKLTNSSSGERQIKTTPIFDWGENDFQFNVPVTFNAGMGANKLLWSGAQYMNEVQGINLPEAISAQNSGIVLVWSAYNADTGTASNYDWHYTFVPKSHVVNSSGAGITTGLITNSNMTNFGSKYVYVTNNRITGNDNNTFNGTRNGVAFTNTYWVLRYVVGV